MGERVILLAIERSECDPPKGNELCKKETKGKERKVRHLTRPRPNAMISSIFQTLLQVYPYSFLPSITTFFFLRSFIMISHNTNPCTANDEF